MKENKQAVAHALRFCKKYPKWNLVSDLGDIDMFPFAKATFGFISSESKFYTRYKDAPSKKDIVAVFKA